MIDTNSPQWIEDCTTFRGEVLKGKYSHWCDEWDGLPVDETTDEFTCCECWPGEEHRVEVAHLKELLYDKRREMEQDAE